MNAQKLTSKFSPMLPGMIEAFKQGLLEAVTLGGCDLEHGEREVTRNGSTTREYCISTVFNPLSGAQYVEYSVSFIPSLLDAGYTVVFESIGDEDARFIRQIKAEDAPNYQVHVELGTSILEHLLHILQSRSD